MDFYFFCSLLVGGVLLIWAFVLFGTALSITIVDKSVRQYGVKTTGRVTNATFKSIYRGRYQSQDEAKGIWSVTYVYTYKGQKLSGTQDLSESTSIPLFHYDRDIEILYLPQKPWVSRIATDNYVVNWRYLWGALLLVIGLILIATSLSRIK